MRVKDEEIQKYIGRKMKIDRADEEFVGNLVGWSEIEGLQKWVLQAQNASIAFLPSEGWEVYDCDGEEIIDKDKPGA